MRLRLVTCVAAGWLMTVGLGSLASAGAAEPPSTLLSFDELQKRLKSPDVRLLDPRPRAEYDAEHIPGAVWVDVKAAQTLAGRKGGLTDRQAWSGWIAPLGLAPKTEVVVYDGKRQLDAARLWWLLRYLGVEKVGLVNGNFPLWKTEGRPVTSETPKVEARPFAVAFRPNWLATREDVLEGLKEGRARIVDARSVGEYTGAEKSSKRGGHIPAACHLEWSNLVDADGRFLPQADLKARLTRLGIKPGESIVTHCQGGGRASVDAFVLDRLGFATRNYYLGWSDWGNVDDTPIVEGTEPAPRP